MSQTRLYLETRKPEAHHIASILDDSFEELGITTALFETREDSGIWCYSVYVSHEESGHWHDWIKEQLGGDAFGLDIQQERLGEVDWVSQSLRDLSPVSAGRFFVHGSHDREEARLRPVPIEIDAGQAFGTGHHGTTAGCLEMLELCLRESRGAVGLPCRAYDVGTGSGVLAIALAKAAPTPILATDIDPVATRTALENCKLNGVSARITCQTAAGFQHPAFGQFGKANLVFANILAKPLEALAQPMSQHLAPGARIILSGLLPHQRARIVAAYRQQGMVLRKWHVREGWLTLLMQVG